jgi:hypothetical protein
MHKTSLSDDELDAVLPLVETACAEHGSVDDSRLAEMAPQYVRKLPARVRLFLEEYRTGQPSPMCVLSGFPVDNDTIGPTPAGSGLRLSPSSALREEMFFLLCATVVGDAFGLAVRQDGQLMQDVLPVRTPAHWETSLGWHTEDACVPVKADYVGLMCLRNPDDVATTICDADWIDWSRIDTGLLSAPEYPFGSGDVDQLGGLGKQPVLFGDTSRPSLSVDPDLLVRDQMSAAAQAAFHVFTRAVETALSGVVLWPGDIAFIDNRRAVHGQETIQAPRRDGTDTWFKRVKLSRLLIRGFGVQVPGSALGLTWPYNLRL